MSQVPDAQSNAPAGPALADGAARIGSDRVQVVDGLSELLTPSWDHEATADAVRLQIAPRVQELKCVAGSGNLDLPGSSNWYVPDIAVVERSVAKGGGALLPDQTLLIVEVTSESNAETDRTVKRRRYAEYGAPLYLLVDRQERTCTLFSEPGELGYTRAEGPFPFGTPVQLPQPFGLALDTVDF
ncbi:Uma2 family endonuclease [Streptomyces sp. bgisy100]|uniref:Uma2 family endonuclease n=1 Tax=Streptomyces sp. bgisy100 TaxID=3413783 RepID=UPI003D73EA63